jgi:ribosomal protein S18 acetylase RimI-like enzyme
MDLQFSSSLETLDWAALADLIERAPLGWRDPVALQRAFRHSTAVCLVYDRQILVGAGRALSDGVWRAAIYDVVVLPERQGRGIGSRIVQQLVEMAGADVVTLYTAPGAERFYEKLGFRKMKTAMALMPDIALARTKGFLE